MKAITILLAIACGAARAAEVEPYACSLGIVTAHDSGCYIIATPDHRVIGIPASDVPDAGAVEADIAAQPLARAKAAKLAAIATAYQAALDAGHEVGEVTYGITDKDQANWIAALTALANAQEVAGFDPAETDATALLGPLLNRAGEPVGSVSVEQFRQIMAALTEAIGALRAGAIAKSAAVHAAGSLEDLEEIEP